MHAISVDAAAAIVHTGGVIAYPTEAVYGLGCDPANEAAVRRLLDIKQRPVDKGLILIAGALAELAPWIRPLDIDQRALVDAHWPGPVTFIVPAAASTPDWLTGDHTGIAVRVSAHPVVRALCAAAGSALVSTSANLAAEPPICNADDFAHGQGARIAERIDGLVAGDIGQESAPSRIVDLLTGERLR